MRDDLALGAEAYSRLRRAMDNAGFRDLPLPLDALTVIDQILSVLLTKSQSLTKLTKQYEHYKQVATELEEGIGPFKEETVRLIKDNSGLRLEIIRVREECEERLRVADSTVRDLEVENTDLKYIIHRFLEKVEGKRGGDSEIMALYGKGGVAVESVVACSACPFCVRVRNYVEFDKGRDPQTQDYLKITDGRMEALQIQIRKLKSSEEDLKAVVGSMKVKIADRDGEIDRLRRSIRPSNVNILKRKEPDEVRRDMELALKSKQMQIDLLQRRNMNLETKLKTTILGEHEEWMLGKAKTVAERELVRDLIGSDVTGSMSKLYPTYDEKALLQKLEQLEIQLSKCCKEKAKLKSELERTKYFVEGVPVRTNEISKAAEGKRTSDGVRIISESEGSDSENQSKESLRNRRINAKPSFVMKNNLSTRNTEASAKSNVGGNARVSKAVGGRVSRDYPAAAKQSHRDRVTTLASNGISKKHTVVVARTKAAAFKGNSDPSKRPSGASRSLSRGRMKNESTGDMNGNIGKVPLIQKASSSKKGRFLDSEHEVKQVKQGSMRVTHRSIRSSTTGLYQKTKEEEGSEEEVEDLTEDDENLSEADANDEDYRKSTESTHQADSKSHRRSKGQRESGATGGVPEKRERRIRTSESSKEYDDERRTKPYLLKENKRLQLQKQEENEQSSDLRGTHKSKKSSTTGLGQKQKKECSKEDVEELSEDGENISEASASDEDYQKASERRDQIKTESHRRSKNQSQRGATEGAADSETVNSLKRGRSESKGDSKDKRERNIRTSESPKEYDDERRTKPYLLKENKRLQLQKQEENEKSSDLRGTHKSMKASRSGLDQKKNKAGSEEEVEEDFSEDDEQVSETNASDEDYRKYSEKRDEAVAESQQRLKGQREGGATGRLVKSRRSEIKDDSKDKQERRMRTSESPKKYDDERLNLLKESKRLQLQKQQKSEKLSSSRETHKSVRSSRSGSDERILKEGSEGEAEYLIEDDEKLLEANASDDEYRKSSERTQQVGAESHRRSKNQPQRGPTEGSAESESVNRLQRGKLESKGDSKDKQERKIRTSESPNKRDDGRHPAPYSLKENERLQLEQREIVQKSRNDPLILRQEEKLETLRKENERLQDEKRKILQKSRNDPSVLRQKEELETLLEENERLQLEQREIVQKSRNDPLILRQEEELETLRKENERLQDEKQKILQKSRNDPSVLRRKKELETLLKENERLQFKKREVLQKNKNDSFVLRLEEELEALRKENERLQLEKRDSIQKSRNDPLILRQAEELESLRKENERLQLEKREILQKSRNDPFVLRQEEDLETLRKENERLQREKREILQKSRGDPFTWKKEEEIDSLLKENERLQREKQERLQKSRADLFAWKKEEELDSLRKENERLQREKREILQKSGADPFAWKKEEELDSLRKENERLQREKREILQKSRADPFTWKKEEELDSLRKENERLQREKREILQKSKADPFAWKKEEELESLRREVEKLQRSQSTFKDPYKSSRLENELEMLKAENERLKRFSKSQKDPYSLKRDEEELEMLRKEVQKLKRQEMDAYGSVGRRQEAEVESLRREIERLQRDKFAGKALEDEVASLKREMERAIRDRDDAMKRADEISQQRRIESTQLASKYGKDEGVKGSLQQDNFKMAQRLREYAGREQELEREVSRLQTTLRNLDRDCDDMRNELNRKDEKLALLSSDLRRLQDESSKGGGALKEMERLRRTLELTERERDEAVKALKSASTSSKPGSRWPVVKAQVGPVGTNLESFEASQRARMQAVREQEFEREISHLKSSVTALDRDKDEMRVELDRKDERLAKMRQDCEVHLGEVSRLTLQLRNMEVEVGATGHSAMEHAREVTHLKHEVEMLRRDLDSMAKERDEALKDCRKLAGAISKEEIERRSLHSELDKTSKEADDLRKQVHKYIEEVRRIEELLLLKEEEMESLIEHYRSLSLEKSTLETQRSSLELQASSIRDDVREAVDANILLKNQLTSANALVTSYEGQLEELTLKISTLENQLSTSAYKEKTSEGDSKAARDLIFTLETKMDKLKLDLATAESVKHKLEAETGEQKAQIELLEEQLKVEIERGKKLEEVMGAAREKEFTVERTTQELAKEKSHLSERLKSLQTRTETLNEEVAKYRLRSMELQNELERTKRQLQNEKAERETALSELRRVQDQLNNSSTNRLLNTAMGGGSPLNVQTSSGLAFSPMSDSYLDSQPLGASTGRADYQEASRTPRGDDESDTT